MNENSSSKIALVTGGSSGIGRAIAEKLNRERIKVVTADISESSTEEGILFRKCDVTLGDEIDNLFSWTVENVGHPDILILCAGQGIKEKLTEGDPEKWQKIINVNLMGPLRTIRAFAPKMVENKNGNVIFVSSVSAHQPHAYGGIYSASKTALEVVAETLRKENLPDLNVTVISPGIVDTGFFSNQLSADEKVEEMGQGWISPEEIAEDVWYALNKRKGTSINKIITRPTSQEF